MIISISSFGTCSRYTVDFSRNDTKALESFLADKKVFLSDRQIQAFVNTGEGVEFGGRGRKYYIKTIVRDITAEHMTEKARDLIRKFKNSITVQSATSPSFMSRALKVKSVAVAYNLTDML